MSTHFLTKSSGAQNFQRRRSHVSDRVWRQRQHVGPLCSYCRWPHLLASQLRTWENPPVHATKRCSFPEEAGHKCPALCLGTYITCLRILPLILTFHQYCTLYSLQGLTTTPISTLHVSGDGCPSVRAGGGGHDAIPVVSTALRP